MNPVRYAAYNCVMEMFPIDHIYVFMFVTSIMR